MPSDRWRGVCTAAALAASVVVGAVPSAQGDLITLKDGTRHEGTLERVDTIVTIFDELKRVVYEPVKLVQEFRSFDFESPWEGANAPLPGDEKASHS